MSYQPLVTHQLENGLVLQCMDQSKKIAADRWFVRIVVRLPIPVEKRWFVQHSVNDDTFRKITEALGERVVFEVKKERNFVSDGEKDAAVKAICDGVIQMGRDYMGTHTFAAKYILRCYDDAVAAVKPPSD